MANRKEVNALFRALFKEIGGFADNVVRPANQAAPVGSGLFATVLISSVDSAQWATSILADDPDSVDMLETVYREALFTLSVQFFREGALDAMSRLVHLLQSSRGIDRMQTLGVGLQNVGQVRDLTALIDTYAEERVQCDLSFYMNVAYLTNIRALLTAHYEINFEDGFQQTFDLELNT